MELRVRRFGVAFEIALTLVLAWFGSLFLVVLARHEWDLTLARNAFLLSAATAILFLRRRRWRRRIVLDDDGVRWRRSKNDDGRRLGWDEVEELFILGPEEFELRGVGKSIAVTPAFDGVGEAREFVSRRLAGLRDRLRDRAMRQGELHFRMPGGRWKAHAFYLAVILVMTLLTAMVAVPMLRGQPYLPWLLLMVLVVGFVWKLRQQASALGTVVTLYRDGLLVRRLDRSRRIAWSTVTATDWNERGGLDLVLQGGKRISLPPQLANVTLLEGFIDEARAAAPNP